MLVDHEDGDDRWIRYTRYNDDGRVIERAHPSAIDMSGTPYNQNEADLDVQLNSDDGLIDVMTYYGEEDLAPSYLNETRVRKGSGGTIGNGGLVTLSKLEYDKHTINSGQPTEATIYWVDKRTVYRSASGGGSDPVSTEYETTFHSGTVQRQSVTEKLPNVPSGENGGAWLTNNSRVQEFDIQGQLAQSTDARGTVTEYQYDNATGSLMQMIQDPTALDLVTDYQVDSMGRTIKSLGPSHNINGQTLRTVAWTVYLDEEHEVRTAQGYLIGSSSYTTVGPVSITRRDPSGRVLDEIQAVLVDGSGNPVVEKSGELSAIANFPQTQWCRWTHHEYDDDTGRLTSTRVYHNIPMIGSGASGTNYDQTNFAYDAMGRRNYVKSPGGTITRTVYDPRGLVLSTWIGTNDTGATDSDPSGGGAGGNNMKAVTINTYDTNAYGSGDNSLDGLLTKVTSPVDDTSANNRVVEYRYDWRDRRTTTITTDGTNTFHATSTLDNLGRSTAVETERTGTPDVRIAKSETSYDTRGQVFRTKRYAVASNGSVGNALTDNTWYDQEGNVLESLPAGSELFTKTTYDAIGRRTVTYHGYYSGSGGDSPLNVTNDVIFEQSSTTYDPASNVTFQTFKQRWHNATGNGALNGPGGSQPKSRDSFTATWYNGIGRTTATADYGTNNNAGPPTRPSSPPASSDTVLVSEIGYNARGEAEDQTDPAGQVTRTNYDNAGRATSRIRNYGSSPTEEVQTTYTADGQMATLTAINSTTGNQVTTYTYGVTLTNSKIASNDLLATVTYPDSGEVNYEYNRQGQRIKMTDQNGSVHEYAYDSVGRQTEDNVSTVGTGVDGAVRRTAWTYDNRQRLAHVTSYSTTSGTSGVTSDIEYLYNDFDQVTTERQQHGAATSGSSPKVQYAYADGSNNTIRRTGCTYPDGKVLAYGYNSGANDKLSRVEKLTWDSTDVVTYSYLGLNQVVIQTYPQPATDVQYTLATGSGSNPYAGLDRFGRIIDLQWKQGTPKRVWLKYGYDRASNRTHRLDEVATANSQHFDERYDYDGLHRLTSFDRGQLDTQGNNLTNATLGQTWDLDPTGNWDEFAQSVTGAFTTTREHNPVNEITEIDTPTGTPVWASPPEYDANGNMTQFPQPNSLGDSYEATWDAWNRLVKLEDTGGTVAEYHYDGLNRRITKTVSGTVRHYYFSDQWQVLEERAGTSSSPDRQYVWGIRYVDDLVLRDRSGERLYALQDALFNVVALTNTSGAVQERFAYQPYGQSEGLDPDFTAYSGTDYEWEYRYTGREFDLESGLQLNRNRYLHLQLGRWLTRDPIGHEGSQWNLYEYGAGSPVVSVDSTGTLPIIPICIGIGIALGTCGCRRRDPPPRTDKECCRDAQNTGEVTDWGHLVCCDGRLVSCSYKPPSGNPAADGIDAACIKEHEDDHRDAVIPCDPRLPTYVPGTKPDTNVDAEECAAYEKHLACLRRRRNDCKGDRICLQVIDHSIQDVLDKANTRPGHCSKIGKPLR